LLLSLPAGDEASETKTGPHFDAGGLSKHLGGRLQVVKRVASQQVGMISETLKDGEVGPSFDEEQSLGFGHLGRRAHPMPGQVAPVADSEKDPSSRRASITERHQLASDRIHPVIADPWDVP
jgi:hypothetical protein